jgi:hypothetical protein
MAHSATLFMTSFEILPKTPLPNELKVFDIGSKILQRNVIGIATALANNKQPRG